MISLRAANVTVRVVVGVTCVLALTLAGCQSKPNDKDKKIAELQQQLQQAKAPQPAAPPQPVEVTLPADTLIAARTLTDLSTATAKNGSTFDALLEEDLLVNGTLVAQKGARVTGVVVSSNPGGRVKGVASLTICAREIEGVKSTMTIQTDNHTMKAGTSHGRDLARTGVMAGIGAGIGAIAGGGKGLAIGAAAGAGAGVVTNLATRGKAAVLPAQSLIPFKLKAPVTVVVPR